jgi:hypothetical protein
MIVNFLALLENQRLIFTIIICSLHPIIQVFNAIFSVG